MTDTFFMVARHKRDKSKARRETNGKNPRRVGRPAPNCCVLRGVPFGTGFFSNRYKRSPLFTSGSAVDVPISGRVVDIYSRMTTTHNTTEPNRTTVDESEINDARRDGNGKRVYCASEEVIALHREAIESGWAHSYDRTPYENLRTLLIETADYPTERSTYASFAYKYIAGYGPGSTPQALDALAEEGVTPGGVTETEEREQ